MFKKILLLSLLLLITITLSPGISYGLTFSSNNCTTSVGNAVLPTGTSIGCSSSSGGFTGFKYYCQGDPHWNDARGCILQAGCGPTSLAMIMTSFGVTKTPVEVDQVFQSQGWRAGCDGGSLYGPAIQSAWFQGQGFTVGPNLAPNGQPDLELMKQFIDKGYLIYNGANNYPCLGCLSPGLPVGHVFVIDDVDLTSKRVHTRDPNNCTFSTGVELTNQGWVMVSLGSTRGADTSPYNAANYSFGGATYHATWNGSFPIKKI